EDKGQDIFKKQFLGKGGVIRSRYSNKYLSELLNKVFEEKTMSDTKTNLLITATDVSNGQVFVCKSNYDKEFVRDPVIKLSDIVLASCSAPGYFKAHKIKEYLLADGGLWANNPSLVALIEAMSRFEKKISNIKLLSIGTGINTKFYEGTSKDNWGLFKGWEGKKLIELIFNAQSKSIENMLKLLMQAENYMRINFERDLDIKMDDISQIDRLKTFANKDFTYKVAEIEKFLCKEQK
ncbi:MAG: patatin-like phospholipase family protein, partial [Atribacterota bacterium]